jgi:hypothetical protein
MDRRAQPTIETIDCVKLLHQLACHRVNSGKALEAQIEAGHEPTQAESDAVLNHPLLTAVDFIAQKLGLQPQVIQEFAERVGTPLGLTSRKTRVEKLRPGDAVDQFAPRVHPEKRDLHHLFPKIEAVEVEELLGLLQDQHPEICHSLNLLEKRSETGGEETEASLVHLEKIIPNYDPVSKDWISNKTMAKHLGVNIETLANHRTKRGIKGSRQGESFGLHEVGCFWRKAGAQHPIYYLPFAKQYAGQLGVFYPKLNLDS